MQVCFKKSTKLCANVCACVGIFGHLKRFSERFLQQVRTSSRKHQQATQPRRSFETIISNNHTITVNHQCMHALPTFPLHRVIFVVISLILCCHHRITTVAFPVFLRPTSTLTRVRFYQNVYHFPRLSTSLHTASRTTRSDAFTSVTLPTPQKIDPEDVVEQIRGGANPNLVIVDVRDGDFAGGHIKGCTNIPSAQINDGFSAIDRLIDQYKAAPPTTFVFHCMKSQQRGPAAAQVCLCLSDSILLSNTILWYTILCPPPLYIH